MLASNIDVQAHIRRSTDLYNLQAQKHQLKNELRHLGENVPQAARQIHEARLARLDADVNKLQEPRSFVGESLLGQLATRTLLNTPVQRDASGRQKSLVEMFAMR